MPRKEFSLEEQHEAKKAIEKELEKEDYYVWQIIPHYCGGNVKTVLISLWRRPNWIRCNKCGYKSYNPGDIKNKYCGHCHEFHKTPECYETGYDKKGGDKD